MNRIAEFYEANHLLILLGFTFLFGIYFLSTKNKKQDTKSQERKTEEAEKIKELSISESSSFDAALPIELIPSNSEDFLQILLKTKSATITTFYKNGTNESKVWNASKMDRKSNVIGNLRSRLEFRNGNWQKANVIKVVVEVNNNLNVNPILEKNFKINLIKTNTMTKDSAIQLVNKKLNLNLNSNNTNWSNINASGLWSMEPKFERQLHKLFLLLNNNRSNKIHVFEIPANHDLYEKLYVRDKKGVFRLVFEISDTEFIEKLKNINLKNFHKGSVENA
jgi:hypothetical protein